MRRKLAHAAALAPLILGAGFSPGCKRAQPADNTEAPRPVSVLTLREVDPIKPLQLTGSVHPWKEQRVAFEVTGRVEWIVEQGKQLEGRWEEDGKVLVAGERLAVIDSATYRAAVVGATADVDYAKIGFDKVLPAELAGSEANLINQQAEMDRVLEIPKDSVTSIEPIVARANRDMAAAKVDQARAELVAGKASLEKAQATLTQARLDLEHTTLYSPFSSEVAEVYVEVGGFVQAGQPVALLVMMDPIKVDLNVAPETARRLNLRDTVRLYVPGATEPVFGVVKDKATVADAATRTLRISIITRNVRSSPESAPGRPAITNFGYLQRVRAYDDTSPFMVEENRALRHDAEGYFVWAAPDHRIGTRIDRNDPSIVLRRFNVVPSDERRNYLGLFLMRVLADGGDLEDDMFLALDVPDDFEDGQSVVIAHSDWRLRPGQLVPVLLEESEPAPGLYVPMDAILKTDEHSGVVFVVDAGLAKRVDIRILDHAGELIRIGPTEAGSTLLQSGAEIILDYLHFLQDGEPVRVIKRRELRL